VGCIASLAIWYDLERRYKSDPAHCDVEPMKITFLSPAPDLSGGQRVLAIYADSLMRRGHDVTVVARDRERPTLAKKLRDLLRRGMLPSRPIETHFDHMEARLIRLSHSGPICAEDVPDADVVIATWWETAFEAMHFPAEKGSKIYFVQGHEVFPYLPTHISGASYFLPLKKIVVSSWLSQIMSERYHDKDVTLVPNGVDHKLFHAPPRERQKVATVGLIYSPSHLKGVDAALRAIELAKERYGEFQIIAFGTSAPTSSLPIPAGTKYYLNMPQNQLSQIYSACDVFVSASRSEGFGLPILEAMACRTPVVATRTGCVQDVINDGENGFAVDVDDVEALASRIVGVLSTDGDEWKKMSAAAYAEALSHSWDTASELFEAALYRQIETWPGQPASP